MSFLSFSMTPLGVYTMWLGGPHSDLWDLGLVTSEAY